MLLPSPALTSSAPGGEGGGLAGGGRHFSLPATLWRREEEEGEGVSHSLSAFSLFLLSHTFSLFLSLLPELTLTPPPHTFISLTSPSHQEEDGRTWRRDLTSHAYLSSLLLYIRRTGNRFHFLIFSGSSPMGVMRWVHSLPLLPLHHLCSSLTLLHCCEMANPGRENRQWPGFRHGPFSRQYQSMKEEKQPVIQLIHLFCPLPFCLSFSFLFLYYI